MSNWITVNGRLGKDAELRTLQDGQKVLSFSVGCDVFEKGAKRTIWYDCSYFGNRAEGVAQYMLKGRQVSVLGGHSDREFQRKDGTNGTAHVVRVDRLDLMGGEGGNTQGQGGSPIPRDYERPPAGGGTRGGGKPAFDPDMDEDLPF